MSERRKKACENEIFDTMISHYLNVGLAGYTGISQSEVAFLYNTLAEDMESEDEIGRHYDNLLQRAYTLGRTYGDSVDGGPDSARRRS